MSSGQSMPEASSPSPVTRRALREAGRAATPGPNRLARALRWLPRAVVLVSLAATTIAVPLLPSGAVEAEPVLDTVAVQVPAGPSAHEVLSASAAPVPATSVLAPVPGLRRVADTSRTLDRSPLPGCDAQARPAGSNGLIATADLCSLWDPAHLLRGDAAVALSELNLTFRAAFGRDLCITDSYRSLAVQRQVAYAKPGLAAAPGTSNHGWGLAIDLCSSETADGAVMGWLGENGPVYGWDNPAWARAGGSGAYEPWHWEFVPGTTQLGTNY